MTNLNSETEASFDSIINQTEKFPIVSIELASQSKLKLDLSVSNQGITPDITPTSGLQEFIDTELVEANAKFGYGGYLENRALYGTSAHFTAEEVRDIHLGIDVWLPAATAIYCPLAAEVHSFKYNNNFLDYGPTIILSHNIDGFEFHTLYGHLSLDSIKSLEVGQGIKAGDKLALLGDKSVNGGWPPHLHFQIILDMQGLSGDYPGVATRSTLDFYSKNCPNPKSLLGFS